MIGKFTMFIKNLMTPEAGIFPTSGKIIYL